MAGLGVIAPLLTAAVLGAASPQPSASPPANTWCPVGVTVTQLDASRVAIGFSTPLPSGRSSGTVSLWTSDSRYDVRFAGVEIRHRGPRAAGGPPLVPLVVRFPAPVYVTAAAVTALDDPTPGPCSPLYAPWSPYLTSWLPAPPDAETYQATNGARAASAPVHEAPPPLAYTPPQCPNRFVPAKTLRAYEPPGIPYTGVVNVLVTVGVDGRAISVEVLKPSGSAVADALALDAAARSQYAPQIFNCEKIVGTYVFTVEFSR